jgi:hypothetical protein
MPLCESFMKTLKQEEVYRNEYRDFQEARASIGEFLERVYNRKRLHSALGYLPPAEFEHHPRQIFRDGEITSGQFPQRAYPVLSLVHRRQQARAQQIDELPRIHQIVLVAGFEQNVLPRIPAALF